MSSETIEYDRQGIEELVIEQIEATGVEPDLISLTATLDSLGLDSLDVVELSQTVKKQTGIPVNPKDFLAAKTISDAIAVIYQRAGLA